MVVKNKVFSSLKMNFQKSREFLLPLFLTFALCFYEAQSSTCGGVLETIAGTVEHSLSDLNSSPGSPRCLWVIKLPVTRSSSVIRFQLNKMPGSSQLSLYPQEGHVAGQITVRPTLLTSANETVTLITNSDTMLVVWAPTDGFHSEMVMMDSQLTFKWEGIRVKGQGISQGQLEDSELVGGVTFVEGQKGKFLWERAGEVQQTLLWVLNSHGSGNSVELTTVTDFETCDLIDLCLCSYLGVYQIYDNFLRLVSTECGRESTGIFKNLQGSLLALGFVNPEFQNGASFVSLNWSSKGGNETTTTTTESPTTCSSGRPKSCSEIQENSGFTNSSQYCTIYPFGPSESSIDVLCDFDTDGGGWTVIQKRISGPKYEFFRNWTQYEQGFGYVSGNFWLGLKWIRGLVDNLDQELRIDLTDWENDRAYAKYSNFSVSDASDFYRLSIDGYSGTAGDSMKTDDEFNNLDGMRFSAKDKDNDDSGNNCADNNNYGAWWYNECGYSNLNGLYYAEGETPSPVYSGMNWVRWKNSARSLLHAEMKIRKKR